MQDIRQETLATLQHTQQETLATAQRMETRLTRMETQMEEREKICKQHAETLTQHDKRINALEVNVGTLRGSWKTYLTVGGISGAIGSAMTWLRFKGGG